MSKWEVIHMKIAGTPIFSFTFIFISFISINCDKNNRISDNFSTELKDTTVVQIHGLLQQNGNKILDKNNEPVCFAGNSFFWSNDDWGGERYYKAEVVSWLKNDWKTTIVRAAMGVEDPGGYLDNKTANKDRVTTIVDAAIDEGIYVIIDWHSHHAEDNTNEAALFFQEMANLYGEYDNVIYEIYNEPLDISWSNTIKPYAISIIATIRSIDPDNLIIVGTPEWSQRVDLAAADPITGYSNIAYTLHFYTVHHQQWLRDRASEALNDGIPIFITEWGSIGYSLIDPEADKWMAWCFENKISHCNWAVNDKNEEWSILVPGASTSGNWSEDDLTKAGKLAKNIIVNWPE
jgi:endoglucanase